MAEPVLKVIGLAVEAGGKTLFEGLDLTLDAGRLTAIVGPSGCGKTTLLRAIAMLINPSQGEVRLSGALPVEIGWVQYRRSVVLIDQRPVLFDSSVDENLRKPFTYASASSAYPEQTASILLDELEIGTERLNQDARSLSIGQQQRVCLIRALLVSPKVMLLDEPTSALDAESVETVEACVKRFAANGGCALVVSHDRAQAARLCDNILDLTPYLSYKPTGDMKGS